MNNCYCAMCQNEGPIEPETIWCNECNAEFIPEDDERLCESCSCEHEESENGICNYCGSEVDWVSRTFKSTERD